MPAAHATRFDFNKDAFGGLDATAMPQHFDEARYQLPPRCADVPEELALYEYAKDCAASLGLFAGCHYYRVVSGNFIFGDLIEAVLVEKHIQAKELTISTYSLSEANIDSLAGLLKSGHVQKLNLIMSAGQFAQEFGGIVKYLLEQLDTDENRFQFAAAGTHCKLALIETARGNKLTFDGSANYRSSGNIEQFNLREGADFYDFNYNFQKRILDRYAVIRQGQALKPKHVIRRKLLWDTIATAETTF
jgi:hypothetical protein